MIVCTKCGFQNEDSDTFCGSCASFLEWSGEKQVVEEPEPQVAEPEPEPEAAPAPSLFDKVKDRIVGVGEARTTETDQLPVPEPAVAVVGAGDVAPSPAVEPVAAGVSAYAAPVESSPPPIMEPASPPAISATGDGETSAITQAQPAVSLAPPPPRPPAPATSNQPTSGTPSDPVVQAAAAAPSAPVAPAAPTGPVQPEAVKPMALRARPVPKPQPKPARVINPGDKICNQCGDGNDPARRFCRRCGASLQQAVVFTPPWYRRLIHRLRHRKVRAAGDRPRQRRRVIGGAGGGWLTSWFTRIVLLAIIVFAILANVGPYKHPIRHRLSIWYHDVANVVHTTYNPVHPTGASATTAAPGHPAGLAIDNASNTCWEAGGTKAGVGESITLNLQSASDIDKIGFINGDNDSPQSFLTEPRLQTIQVTFGTSTPYVKTFTLKDESSFQTFTIGAKSATSVTITIESVYGSSQGKNAALTEVELFKKS